MPCCPTCHSECVVKNGSIHTGKQKFACKACGRQFVEDPQLRIISDETKALIDTLLLERISLAGIARVVGVSERWLQPSVNEKYRTTPRTVQVRPKKRGA
jgi:transposase-like protein